MSDIGIIYEDNDLIAVDKPVGLLTVPIPNSHVPSLFDVLKRHYAQQGERVFVVHRIDRYTSGIVMFAKNQRTFYDLKEQFMERSTDRIYLAVVQGVMKEPVGTLVHYLKKIQEGFRNIVVPPGTPNATEATLHYRVTENLTDACLVEVKLESGLKNQIRAQFTAMGHPVIGDRQYGTNPKGSLIDRQALHAHKLAVTHPRTGERCWFQSPMPDDMRKLIRELKKA